MIFNGRVERGMVVLETPLPLPDGTPVRVEPVARGEFWRSPSLAELAQQQHVRSPASVDDLLGGWPIEDLDDDFENVFVVWRQSELERRE